MSNLIITGVIDGPLTGGTPKAIELYALSDIADLSIYAIEGANNGDPSTGPEFTLTGSATAGEYIYVASETTQFNTFFGFNPNFVNGVANINGDDTIVLFENGAIVDVFGEIGVDGTGTVWEHLDGWAYRNNGSEPNSTFNPSEWTFSGVDALDGDTVNSTATPPWPVATFSSGDSENSASLDLSNYVRIGRYDLPEPTRTTPPSGSLLAQEVSAITYNPDTDSLFVLGDEGTAIVQIDKTGQLIDSMTLTDGDFADLEGLTYVGNNQFVLVEERLRQASLFTYTAGGTLSRGDVQTVDLGTNIGNIGLEGVSNDPQSNGFIFVKETNPQGVFQTEIDFDAGTATNGSPTTENSTNLFDPALLGFTDIADVFALSNVNFLSGQGASSNLLILSQEDGKLVEVDRAGNILSTLAITADVGNPLTVTNHGFEGITLDNNGLLYVTSENGGGDGDHPQVWVYAPSSYTYSNAAPVAVSVANGVTSLLDNSDTTSDIKLGNIIVSDDAQGTNNLTLSGTDAGSFTIIGNELFLAGGTVLDFATKPSYTVTIEVDDSTVGNTPDAITNFTFNLVETAGATPLIVSEVAPWSSGNSSLGADWFEITNTGDTPIDITGWVFDDDSASFANGSALSGVTSISAGQSVVFVDGDTATIAAFIDLWFGGTAPDGFAIGTYDGPGLGTGGDAVNLFNATGGLVTGANVGASPSASPFATFDNATGIPFVSSLSNVGINGAFSVIDTGEGVILTGSPGAIAGTPSNTTMIGIVATVATASENASSSGEFTILRTGDTTVPLDITYSLSGDATNGTDYTAINATTVTIPAGQSQVAIALTPVDDNEAEATESVTITVTDTADYDIQSGAESATVTIEDNDVPLANFNLQITEMWNGNDLGSNLTADWFEITNTGTEAWVSGVEPDLYYDDDSQDPTTADLVNGITQLDPGETAIVLIGVEADVQSFRTVWESVIDLTNVEIGYTDGAGLGAGGDGVSLFVGLPSAGDLPVDFETYPDTTGNGGKSYDVNLAMFSVEGENGAVATAVNDGGEAAIASPGFNTLPLTPTIVKIHEIQGDSTASSLVGNTVTIEAIVVGDFQDGDGDASRNLRGFYVQEEDTDIDGNALTSEGIFVFENGDFIVDVNVGDLVQITGTVDEFFGETQIDTITNITVLSPGNNLPTSAPITLPTVATTISQNGNFEPDLEAYEGMLVNFSDTLTITEMFQLDRFNEIKLVQGDRPQQFTQSNTPDQAGLLVHLEEVGARTITYDDGLNQQNALIGNLDGFGPTFNTASDIRMGDTIDNLSGILSYQWAGNSASGATWRVRSTQDNENTFTKVNERPVTPDEVGGSLKVTGFNVLNYFKTLDDGSSIVNGNAPRGADNATEFDRQTEKLLTALSAIDADVLGLVELENDFLPGSSGNAIEFLVNELNGIFGAGTYDWVNPGTQFIGDDAIAVGLIYKPGAVTPVGNTAILDSPDFLDPNNTGENRNRPSVAQSFQDVNTGEIFTTVVNHFKSKGASGLTAGDATNPDSDQGDGQGFWNDTRTKASQALVSWLNTDPTGVSDTDFLLFGDFNAYAQEDPIQVLQASGYVNLADFFSGGTATSYVFNGQTGTLDYAFASPSLFNQVSGATEWGINSDEADAIDYNTDFGRDANIFDGTVPYRTSDHDPVIVGLNLGENLRAESQNRRVVSGIEFLGEVTFATGTEFDGTVIGGLSGIVYDSNTQTYYSISDDRTSARFYDLTIDLADGSLDDGDITFTDVTTLLDQNGNPFPALSLDPEAIALTRNGNIYISSEGDANALIAPFVNEFNLSGLQISELPIDDKFLPTADQSSGIRNNLSFESATITPDGRYLYTATENALYQDGTQATVDDTSYSRIIKYDLVTKQVVAEYVYEVEPVAETPIPEDGFQTNGLVELLALDNNGTLLALERSFSAGVGNTVKLYQVLTQGALNAQGFNDLFREDEFEDDGEIFPPDRFDIDPFVIKKELLDFADLGITPDNLEGIALGEVLPDGSQSLIVVSDNNFSDIQTTQFIALGLDIETIPSVLPVTETPQTIDDEDYFTDLTEPLNILLVNDDGYQAEGIKFMYDALVEAGHNVTIVAPKTQQSGKGTAIDTEKIFQVLEVVENPDGDDSTNDWYVDATPVTTTLTALGFILDDNLPDLVVSGINEGENIGLGAISSGTLSAAVTAVQKGIPAIAVSAGLDFSEGAEVNELTYEIGANYVVNLIAQLQQQNGNQILPDGVGLNVNIPSGELTQGITVTRFDESASFDLLVGDFGNGATIGFIPQSLENGEVPDFDSEGDQFLANRIPLTPFDGDWSGSDEDRQEMGDRLSNLVIPAIDAEVTVNENPLTILLVNDDSYLGEGINVIYDILTQAGHNVIFVAPKEQQSGKGTSFDADKIFQDLELMEFADNQWYVDGTPITTVWAGLDYILPTQEGISKPDLVISGINEGENVGLSAVASGTLSAAVSALQRGIPSIAVSAGLDLGEFQQGITDSTERAYQVGARFITDLITELQGNQGENEGILPQGVGLNVNIPALAESQTPNGVAITKFDETTSIEFIVTANENNEPIFTIGQPIITGDPESEGGNFLADFITVTPFDGDWTAESSIAPVNDDLNQVLLGDSDDPAVWIDKENPNNSIIVATLKDGGLVTFNLDGTVQQNLRSYPFADIRYNNVDVLYDFNLNGEIVDLAVASDRENDTLGIFKIDPETRQLLNVNSPDIVETIFGVDDGEATAYGLGGYKSPVTGNYYVFVTQADGNQIAQLELKPDGNGLVTADVVRIIDLPVEEGDDASDYQSEAIVVDQERGIVYVGVEDKLGIIKFNAEPFAGNDIAIVRPTGSPELVPDLEGLGIYYGADGTGYLMASSQGDSSYALYSRDGDNQYLGSFIIADNDILGIDQANETDGLDIVNVSLGDEFPFGVLIVQDGANDPQNVVENDDELENNATNFKLVPWESVANAFEPVLVIDTESFDPMNITTTLPNGVASGDVTQDSAVLWARSTVGGDLTFELATDLSFANILNTITLEVTDSSLPVKVQIDDLEDNTEYFYRAIAPNGSVTGGRFVTASQLGEFNGLSFGVTGDWRGELSPYPAISNVAEFQLDFFVQHGDTIYADYGSDAVLNPDGTRKEQVETLEEYRAKHAEVYSTRLGQNYWAEVRSSTSILATIDDHEVINDFAGGELASSDDRFPETEGLINDTQLYENGLQSFQEYNPLRDEFYGDVGDERFDGERKLYRSETYGSDGAVMIIDTRSFRDEALPTPDFNNPEEIQNTLIASLTLDRTLLGETQLEDLKQDLLDAEANGITWKFVMIPEPIQNILPGITVDSYEGYGKERTELLKFIQENNIQNVVFVAADVHSTYVNNLTYQELTPDGIQQIPVPVFEITTGSVAFDQPTGEILAEIVIQQDPTLEPFYNSLPIAPDADDIVNDKDDFVKSALNEQTLAPFGFDPLGLNNNLASAEGLIDAELLQGDYYVGHTFGWTQFDIDADTQELLITTYGIEAYSEEELLANPDEVLSRQPFVVSQFAVNPNNEPLAVDDTVTTDEDTLININNLLDNDSDIDGDNLVIQSIDTTNTIGLVTLNDDGTVTYNPNGEFESLTQGQTATTTFEYTITDNRGGVDTATVTVTIEGVNDNPIAVDDELTTDEDTQGSIAPLTNDTDIDGDDLTITAVTNGGNGTVTNNNDGTVTYTPNPDFNGEDSFTYTISDGNGGTDTATVNVTVNPVNDAPIAVDDELTIDEDTAGTIAPLTNDTDIDGDDLTITAVTNGGNGTVTNNNDGTVTYTPNPDFNGEDSFTYTISDGNGGTDTATVNVTVNPVNDAPIAVDDELTIDEDTAGTIAPLINDIDIDGDSLNIIGVTDGSNGTVTNNNDGTVTYTPNPDFNGEDSFTYTISDGNGGTDTATVNVTVNPLDDETIELGDEGGEFDFSDRTNNLNIIGGAGDDNITSGSGSDRIDPAGGDNIVNAGAGDDVIIGSGLPDIDNQIDGGEGNDTVIYDGAFADFSISVEDGVVTVGTNTDTLTNVEQLQFSDRTVLVEDLIPDPIETLLNDPLFRFQNSDRPGTYLLAGETESESVRQNFPQFVNEGFAFNVSEEADDQLMRFNRFQNSDLPGAYLYAGEEESESIRQNYPNFVSEGVAFYALSADANLGTDIYRFQNTSQPGSYIFVAEEERDSILANFPQFTLEGVAFEVVI